MTQSKSVVLMLALGALGAAISTAFLLVTDGAPHGYGQLIGQEGPVLVVVAGMGFCAGMLIALLWSVLQQVFTANAPRT